MLVEKLAQASGTIKALALLTPSAHTKASTLASLLTLTCVPQCVDPLGCEMFCASCHMAVPAEYV